MRVRHASAVRRILLGRQVGERGDRDGRVDDHLLGAGRGLGGEEVGVRVRAGSSASAVTAG
jgi:hypothetical protein